MNPIPTPVGPNAEPAVARRTDAGRILVLGLNLWAVAVLVPAVVAGEPLVAALSVATLAPLGLGVALLGRTDRARVAALVLGAFPAAVVGAAIALERTADDAGPPLFVLILAGISLLAHGALTAFILGRPEARLAVRHRDMSAVAADPTAVGRRWRRAAMLAIAGVGALALTLVAPFAGGEGELRRAWGDAAPAAGTLTAVVGGTLGALVLASFVGPGLRRQRPPTANRQRWRVAMFLLVALSGGVVHHLLTRAGEP